MAQARIAVLGRRGRAKAEFAVQDVVEAVDHDISRIAVDSDPNPLTEPVECLDRRRELEIRPPVGCNAEGTEGQVDVGIGACHESCESGAIGGSGGFGRARPI